MNESCPFCQKSPADYYLESENFAAIYNISPILPGHSLIIPKKHVESLFDLSEAELAEFMSLGRKAALLMSKIFDTQAFNWAVQEREEAGQSVAHLHMHVVPRKIHDLPDPGAWYMAIEERYDDLDTFRRFQLSQAQLNEMTQKMRSYAKELF